MANPIRAALTFLVALTLPLSAADTFVKIPGVSGSSNQASHPDWVGVEEFHLNVAPPLVEKGNKVQTQCSARFAMPAGRAGLEIVPLVGSPIVGSLTVEKTRPQTGETYLRWELKNATITSYSVGGSSSDTAPTESFSLSFGAIEFAFTPQKPDGSNDAEVRTTYDCDDDGEK